MSQMEAHKSVLSSYQQPKCNVELTSTRTKALKSSVSEVTDNRRYRSLLLLLLLLFNTKAYVIWPKNLDQAQYINVS